MMLKRNAEGISIPRSPGRGARTCPARRGPAATPACASTRSSARSTRARTGGSSLMTIDPSYGCGWAPRRLRTAPSRRRCAASGRRRATGPR
eukprot:scaffold99503_cov27-Phaeocystis_antarctica.AAC.1